MFWKDHLASEILARREVSYAWLVGQTDRYPSLRVKTTDANGRVPVIQFNGKGEWLKPKEWAEIHIANLKQRHLELHHRLDTVGCDPSTCEQVDGYSDVTVTESQSDPSDDQPLQPSYDDLLRSYLKLIEELNSVAQGNEMNPKTRKAVARMCSTRGWFLL